MKVGPNLYEQKVLEPKEVAWNEDRNKYHFAPSNETDNVVKTFIDDLVITNEIGVVTGESFDGVIVEVWVRYELGGVYLEEKRAQGLSSELVTGISFDCGSEVVAVQLKVSSGICLFFDESAWWIINPPLNPLQGINYMQLGFDFKVS